MAPLISSSQISALTGIYSQAYDLFSSGSNSYITIVKQPIQQINNPGENVIAGYGADNQNITDITYIPVTGYYPAVVFYPGKNLQFINFANLKLQVDTNAIYIKVKNDAKDFLLNGKTERIIIDGTFFNHEITPEIENFLGLKYWIFKLTTTN